MSLLSIKRKNWNCNEYIFWWIQDKDENENENSREIGHKILQWCVDNTFVQAVMTRKAWLQSFEYEIDSDDISENIDALLKEEIDVEAEPFGRYEEERKG